MPSYDYQVVTADGKVVRGATSGDDEEAVVGALRSQGFSILDLRPSGVEEPGHAPSARRAFAFEPFGVSERARVVFARGFATTLLAGLPMLRALTTLRKQTSSPGLRRVLGDVTMRIQQGESLGAALGQHRRVFSDLLVSMVRVGEASGSLEVTMERAADMLERDYDLHRKIGTALAYPLFVLFFSLVMVYAMVAFLLPGFLPFFSASGVDLKTAYPLTWTLMRISDLARDPWAIAAGLVVLVLLLVGLWVAARSRWGRRVLDTVVINVPLLGGLVRTAVLVRFCRTFATLSGSGVPLLECFRLLASSAGNEVVARSLTGMARDLQAGTRISKTLAAIPFFPPLLVQMATVGEETGTLATTLDRVAAYYERDLESGIAMLTSLVEPAMMLFVGGVVCTFVLGVLMPILGMSSLLGGGS